MVRSQYAGSDATTKDTPGSADSDVTTKDTPGSAGSSPTSSSSSTGDPVRFDSSGNVQVYIHLENTDDETLRQLRDLGATVEITNTDWDVLQAWVPIAALDQIAALDAVQEITPPDYAETKAGRVNSQGGAIHRADLVRQLSGLSGRGVKVGVISGGVDARHTAQVSGDLPRNVEIDPDRRGNGEEGTALLEIVHDLAPDASLAFPRAGSSLGFVEATLWLANDAFNGEGAGIIVDDLGYYGGPDFEDGPVAPRLQTRLRGVRSSPPQPGTLPNTTTKRN